MNSIKRKVAGLFIGIMAIGGVVAMDTAASVATAPKAEAATSSYSYQYSSWKCHQYETITPSAIGRFFGNQPSVIYRGVVPNWLCGR